MTVARLETIAAQCPDPALRQWLGAAIRKIGAGIDPAAALDLRGSGALKQRNDLLRKAALATGIESDWPAAGVLAASIKTGAAPNQIVSDCLMAAENAARVPNSQRAIYSILLSTH
ncbi:hypothetical protein CXB77_06025 (plasmid) [Chromatium okenii]|uniref:Uncharacterized protein n=1 Tax=Chromatium okenii TaxID=61644 RepID=A0A2S7XSP0_9GAMM|nr:hypothetical protein CXB77_06025 [Chromatium okenii]